MWCWEGFTPSRNLTSVSGHFAEAGTSCRTERILQKYFKHSHVAASTVSHPLAHQTAYALAILACLGLLLQIAPSRKGLACMFVECPSFLDGEKVHIQLHEASSQRMKQAWSPPLLVREGRAKLCSCPTCRRCEMKEQSSLSVPELKALDFVSCQPAPLLSITPVPLWPSRASA